RCQSMVRARRLTRGRTRRARRSIGRRTAETVGSNLTTAAKPLVFGNRTGRFLARLECLQDGGFITGCRRPTGLVVDAHELDAGGSSEGNRRNVGQRLSHEVAHDWSREIASCLAMPERAWLIVTDIDPGGQVGREPDEPGVLVVVGGAGLAGD